MGINHGEIEITGAALAVTLFLALSAILPLSLSLYHPHDRFGLANVMTLMRATLVILLTTLMGNQSGMERAGNAITGLGLLLVALDGVDGVLARRAGLASVFGARFDLEVDAFTMLVLGALVVERGQVGVWAMLPGLMRYLFIAATWPFPWLSAPLPASELRRGICALLGGCLALALSPSLSPSFARAFVGLGLVAVTFSFGRDIFWLYRRGNSWSIRKRQRAV